MTLQLRALVLAAFASALVAGCSGSSSSGSSFVALSNGSGEVGPGGGAVTFSGGAIAGSSVVIPPAAISSAVTITIAPGTLPLGGYVPVGPAVRFAPAGTMFAGEVTLRVPVDRLVIPAGKSLADVVVIARDDSSLVYEVLSIGGHDDKLRLAILRATHLGTFQAAVATGAAPTITGTTGPVTSATPTLVGTLGGQTIRIVGTNLFPGATVKIGDDELSGNDVLADPAGTFLEVVTLAHDVGAVDIEVTNLDGQSASRAGALDFVNDPFFLDTVGPQTVAGGSSFAQTVRVVDPNGGPVTFELSPAITGASVSADGTVSFAPGLFRLGTFTTTLTATGAAGSVSQDLTFTVPRPTEAIPLLSTNVVLPGAPGGATLATIPTPSGIGLAGELATSVAFVGTTVTGILHRQAIAGVGSLGPGGAFVAPASGIAIVASGGGPAPGADAVFSSANGFGVAATDVNGVTAFIARVTSDSDATTTKVVYSIAADGTLAGPLARVGTVASLSTQGAAAPVGTFTDLTGCASDGAGGVWFTAAVSSSTNPGVNVTALYRRASGAAELMALEGALLPNGKQIQASAIQLVGATGGSAWVLLGDQASPSTSLYRIGMGGLSTAKLVVGPGTLVDGGANLVTAITGARIASRSGHATCSITLNGATAAEYVFTDPNPTSTATALFTDGDSLLGGTATPSSSSAPEDSGQAALVPVTISGGAATRALVRADPSSGITNVVDQTNTPVPTAGGRLVLPASGLSTGSSAASFASGITGGARASGLFTILNGSLAGLAFEAEALPSGLTGTFGSFAAAITLVHPESGLVIASGPVSGAPYARLLFVR